MALNSCAKGKRGERSFAAWLRENWGLSARRGRQYSGSPDSPDVIGLPGVHFEVKNTQRLNLWQAFTQAVRDSGQNIPVLAHKKRHSEWLLVLRAQDLLSFQECLRRSRDARLPLLKDSHARVLQARHSEHAPVDKVQSIEPPFLEGKLLEHTR